mgnify:FL=1
MKTYEIIRTLREERNWSQKDMAEKLNMSVNGYAKIERGENSVNIFRLEQIAAILEVDVHELLPQPENNPAYLIIRGDNNQGSNNLYQGQELSVEIEKLKQTVLHKDEIISRLESELTTLRQVVALLQTKS